MPCARRARRASSANSAAARCDIPPGTAIIGNITLRLPCDRGAQQRADLHAKDLRPRQRQPDAAQAEERIALLDREARHRLVAAGIDGADGDRLARRPTPAPCGRRRYCVSSSGRPALPNRNSVRISPTPSQVAMSMRVDIGGIGDVDLHAHRRVPSSVAAGCGRIVLGTGAARAVSRRTARGSCSMSASVGPSTMPPCSASSSAMPSDPSPARRRGRPPSARRASAPAWRHGWPCCRR